MFADLFVLLYAAHLAADYPLQTDHQAAHKADPTPAGWRANLTHATTHVATCAIALTTSALLPGTSTSLLPSLAALAWIGTTHAVIDRRWPVRWWMEHTRQTQFAAHGGAAHIDQTAHVLALAAAALFLTTA